MSYEAWARWGELSKESAIREKSVPVTIIVTSAEKRWLERLCAYTKITQQFYVVQAFRFFDHVRVNFQEDHGDAKRRFPYLAPLTPAEDGKTVYRYSDDGQTTRQTISRKKAENHDYRGEETRRTERVMAEVPRRVSTPVREWTEGDLQTFATGYYTGFVLLREWIESGGEDLGPYHGLFRGDPNWKADVY